MNGALGKRYARALAGAARSENRLEEVSVELAAVSAWLTDPKLGDALGSPIISTEARENILAEIAKALQLSQITQNFLALLVSNHRIGEIAGIDRAYRDLVDKELGRVRAELHTARPLPEGSIEEIRQGLSRAHGREVLLTNETDTSLVGGLTVEIEGRVYDGSVRTQLVELARTLTRGASTN